MPNRLLTLNQVAKIMLKDVRDKVKEVSPDKPGQKPDTYNPEQQKIFKKIGDSLSRAMFYSRSPF